MPEKSDDAISDDTPLGEPVDLLYLGMKIEQLHIRKRSEDALKRHFHVTTFGQLGEFSASQLRTVIPRSDVDLIQARLSSIGIFLPEDVQ